VWNVSITKLFGTKSFRILDINFLLIFWVEHYGKKFEIRVRGTIFSQIRPWRHRKDDFLSHPWSWVVNGMFPHILDFHRRPMTDIVAKRAFMLTMVQNVPTIEVVKPVKDMP